MKAPSAVPNSSKGKVYTGIGLLIVGAGIAVPSAFMASNCGSSYFPAVCNATAGISFGIAAVHVLVGGVLLGVGLNTGKENEYTASAVPAVRIGLGSASATWRF